MSSLRRGTPAQSARGGSGGSSFTSSASGFLASVSQGTLIATLVNPYTGATTFETVGTVPGQLALSVVSGVARVVRGASAPTEGQTYGIKIRAISADTTREVAETFSYQAQAAVVIPSLSALALSASGVVENSAAGVVIGSVLNKTSNSTLTLTNNGGGRFALNGSNQIITTSTGTNYESATSHGIGITETLAGSANSPRVTNLTINVSNVNEQPNLVALQFASLPSPLTIGQTATGAISGATAGSTISSSGLPSGLTIDGPGRIWNWSGVGTAGTTSPTLTETLADSANSPRVTNLSITIAAGQSSPGDIEANQVAFGPAAVQPYAWYSISEPDSLLKQNGSVATVAGDEIWTWLDSSGNNRHAVAAGTGATAGTTPAGASANAGRLAVDGERVAGNTLRPVVPAGLNFRFRVPTGFPTSSNMYILAIGKVRSTQTLVNRTLVSHTGANSAPIIKISDATLGAGAVTAGTTTGTPMEVNTAARSLMVSVTRTGNVPGIGRLRGSDNTTSGSSWGNNASQSIVLGNDAGNNIAADFAWFDLILLARVPTVNEMRMLEGWAKDTYGSDVTITAGHPFESTPPTIRAELTSTAGSFAVDYAKVLGPFLGSNTKSFNDSFSPISNLQGTPPPGSSTAGMEMPLWSMTQESLDSYIDAFYPGNGRGLRYAGIDLGFLERHYRRFAATVQIHGYLAANKLYVTSIDNGGTIRVPPNTNNLAGHGVVGAGVRHGTEILSQDSGTTGGVGVYSIRPGVHTDGTSTAQTVASVGAPIAMTTGAADLLGSRYIYPGENGRTGLQVMKYAFRHISDVTNLSNKNEGGGIQIMYHTFAPEFKTNRALAGALLSIASGSSTALTDVWMAANTVAADARLEYLTDCMMNDFEFYHTNVGPIKLMTPIIEASNPQTGAYGTVHQVDPMVQLAILKKIIPKLRNSTVIADLTLYGGGPGQNTVRIHADSMYGDGTAAGLGNIFSKIFADSEVLSTGKTVLQEMWGASRHDLGAITGRNVGSGLNAGQFQDMTLTDVSGSGSDIVRTEALVNWTTARLRTAGIQAHTDENEDFATSIPRAWRTLNRVLMEHNFMSLHTQAGGLTLTTPLYVSKLTNSTDSAGYCLAVVDPATKTWDYHNDGWGAHYLFFQSRQWNAQVRPVTTSISGGNTQVASWDNPDGKRVVSLVNRSPVAYAPNSDIIFSDAPRLMRGTRLKWVNAQTATDFTIENLGVINANSFPMSVDPWAWEVWEEIDSDEASVTLVPITLSTLGPIGENVAAGYEIATIIGKTIGSTLTLTDTAGSRFAIAGNKLIRGANPLDYETNISHNITFVESLGGATNTGLSTTLTITVSNDTDYISLNALTLDDNVITEETAAGVVVGTIVGATANSTLTLTNNSSGEFVLSGLDILTTSTTINSDGGQGDRLITVRETLVGAVNNPRDTSLVIDVAGINEAPTNITLTGGSVSHLATEGTVVATFGFVDPDDSTFGTWSFETPNFNASNRFTLGGSGGNDLLVGNVTLVAGTYNVTVRFTDNGGLYFTKDFAIEVTEIVIPTTSDDLVVVDYTDFTS